MCICGCTPTGPPPPACGTAGVVEELCYYEGVMKGRIQVVKELGTVFNLFERKTFPPSGGGGGDTIGAVGRGTRSAQPRMHVYIYIYICIHICVCKVTIYSSKTNYVPQALLKKQFKPQGNPRIQSKYQICIQPQKGTMNRFNHWVQKPKQLSEVHETIAILQYAEFGTRILAISGVFQVAQSSSVDNCIL